MVGDPRFAGGIDHQRREFRHEDARFEAGASPKPNQSTRFEEFFDAIENIEIDNSTYRQPGLARQPGELGRRVAVSIVREEGVGVEVDCAARFRKRDLAELGGPPQQSQRFKSPDSVEGVQLMLQLFNADHRPPHTRLSAPFSNHGQRLIAGRTLAPAAIRRWAPDWRAARQRLKEDTPAEDDRCRAPPLEQSTCDSDCGHRVVGGISNAPGSFAYSLRTICSRATKDLARR